MLSVVLLNVVIPNVLAPPAPLLIKLFKRLNHFNTYFLPRDLNFLTQSSFQICLLKFLAYINKHLNTSIGI